MGRIIDFLSSPVWQGISGLLALVALFVALRAPRKFLEVNPASKWASKAPWFWLFVVGGLAAAVSIAIKFQDVYRVGTVVFATASIALGIQVLQYRRSANVRKLQLQQATTDFAQLLNILRRIANIHRGTPADFRADDRHIVYSINETGDDVFREELTLIPSKDPVYFLFKRYTRATAALNISAESLSNGTPLSVFELERSDKDVQSVVLIDPPSTLEKPQRIAIVCRRSAIWTDLVQHQEDEGSLRLSFQTNVVEVEFLAPNGKKWKGFIPVPHIGSIKIDSSLNASRIIWRIENPPARVYSYRVFWE
jgi:hypothetical protein